MQQGEAGAHTTQWSYTRVLERCRNENFDSSYDWEVARRFGEPADDGYVYIDAVLEGGGVKGFAFLGALQVFEDHRIKFRKVAGTSVGAITASALVSGMKIADLQAKLGPLDFKQFLSERAANQYLMNKLLGDDPSTYLDKQVQAIAVLLLSGKTGLHKSGPVVDWLDKEILHGRTFEGLTHESHHDEMPWHERKALKLITSDISAEAMRVLPDDLFPVYGEQPKFFSVAEACRQSMSLPLFFEPALQRHKHGGGTSTIVDGGVLSNFPLWIFDAERIGGIGARPRCPTIGFELVEQDDEEETPQAKTGIISLVIGIVFTLLSARDAKYERANPEVISGRVVPIPVPRGIKSTSFDLTDEQKDELWMSGYRAAADFIKKFDFDEHLKLRGYAPAGGAPAASRHVYVRAPADEEKVVPT